MASTVKTYAANVDFLQEGSAYARALARLPEWRRERAQRFAFEKDRQLSVGAWLLLEYAVAREGADLSRFAVVRGEHGKPAFVRAATVSAFEAESGVAPPPAPAVFSCESGETASMPAFGSFVSYNYAACGATPTAVSAPAACGRDGSALAPASSLPLASALAPEAAPASSLPLAPVPLLHFNLSHSGSEVLCAISRECEVGCDVEELREFDEGLARYCMQPAEVEALLALPAGERPRAFIRRWVCKESYMKARGMGLSLPPDSFAVELAADLPVFAAPEAAPPAPAAASAPASAPVSTPASACASLPAAAPAASPAAPATASVPAVPARVTDDAMCALAEFPCSTGYAYAACAVDSRARFAPLIRVPGTLLG